MAGAGFKTFNTGDVLTASDVNTYLMQQTTMVFADASARSTALGANVAEGMISYLKDTNATEVYDGSSWVAISGDITGVTAGTGLTGGGTSGAVTLDFDVANYGGGQWAAGKNKCINGDFGIWQRGTSFTLSTGVEVYAADRFTFVAAGSSTAGNVSREAFNAGTAPVSGYEGQYFARLTNFATATSFQIRQKIEDVRKFAGQTMTFSFWIKGDNALSTVTAEAAQYFGSGGSSPVSAGSSTFSITTGWVRQSFTFTIPSIAGKTIGTGSYFEVTIYKSGGITGGQKVDIWGWQAEAGSSVTPFQTATGNPASELAACQRYYVRSTSQSAYGWFPAWAGTTSTTAFNLTYNLPVQMRIAPTSIEYGGALRLNAANDAGISITSLTFASVATPVMGASTGVSATATSNTFYRIQANNDVNAYIGWSAEL